MYQLVDSGQGTIWTSGYCAARETDFGYVGRKTVRKVRFFGEGEVDIVVESGQRSIQKHLCFEDGVAELKMLLCGEKFEFYFSMERASKVTEVVVEFEMPTGYKEE